MNLEQNMATLVTGGRGFIGSALLMLLQHSGYRVLSLDRQPVTSDMECHGCKQIECDLADENMVEAVFESESIGAIVHLAAILPTAARREPSAATLVNVHGSHILLNMAKKFGVRRFVFGSSLSVYGTCPADRVVSERDRTAPEDLYGAAKAYVEQLGEAYRETHGVGFVSLRIGRVVGPGSRSVSSAWRSEIFESLRAEHPVQIDLPYAASERILVVHVEHVAQMLLRLLSAPRPKQALYNAVCESVVVDDLKHEVERLNTQVRVNLGGEAVVGNPRRLDSSRFAREFDFRTRPIFEQMAAVVGQDRQ